MLFLSLVASGILLLIAIGLACKSDSPISQIIGLGLLASLAPVCGGMFLPALALQAGLLSVAMIAWRFYGRGPAQFVLWSSGLTVMAYAILSWPAFQEVQRLRAEFPYVSMEQRLPRPIERAADLGSAAIDHLEVLEDHIEHPESRGRDGELRKQHLRQLHEHTVMAFANRPGFGAGRMSVRRQWILRQPPRTGSAIPQPGTRLVFAWSSGELETAQVGEKESWDEDSWSIHRSGVVDFVHPDTFGYFRDRQHVAGFQPHHLSKLPKLVENWSLQTLDLVGLIVHDKPVAYVSENLPRMEELREAQTRPLDEFEAVGLNALRHGEDLFLRERPEGRRMLGAIRAAKQCVACHGCERGDLLGAFSYTMTRADPKGD